MHYVQQFVERTLIFWLTLGSGFALWWGISHPAAREYFELCNRWTMTPAIVSAMFCIGFLLPRDELRQVLRQGKSVLGGCLAQYACMPLLAFVIATLLGLEGPLFAGMVLTGAVPGAMASNVLTLAARGNVSYSISLTTVATLVSPLAVPLALFLFLGVRKGPEPSTVFVNLLQTVAVPVLAGFTCKLMLRRETEFPRAAAGLIANLAILWIIAVAIGLNANRLSQVTALMLLAMLCLNLAGYCAGWLASRIMSLDVRKSRALILEIGMQNAGVGTVLALKFFDDPGTAIPTAVYTFGCMFTGTLLANYWSWRGIPQHATTLEPQCPPLQQNA